MIQKIIYNNSLRFSKAVYGLLTLLVFFLKNPWLVLAMAFITVLAIIYDPLYSFYQTFLRKKLKDNSLPSGKKPQEIVFTFGSAGFLLFISFFLLYFEKGINFAWILVLFTSILRILSGFVNLCFAGRIYNDLKRVLGSLTKN